MKLKITHYLKIKNYFSFIYFFKYKEPCHDQKRCVDFDFG